jgi:hypothetical protein
MAQTAFLLHVRAQILGMMTVVRFDSAWRLREGRSKPEPTWSMWVHHSLEAVRWKAFLLRVAAKALGVEQSELGFMQAVACERAIEASRATLSRQAVGHEVSPASIVLQRGHRTIECCLPSLGAERRAAPSTACSCQFSRDRSCGSITEDSTNAALYPGAALQPPGCTGTFRSAARSRRCLARNPLMHSS